MHTSAHIQMHVCKHIAFTHTFFSHSKIAAVLKPNTFHAPCIKANIHRIANNNYGFCVVLCGSASIDRYFINTNFFSLLLLLKLEWST